MQADCFPEAPVDWPRRPVHEVAEVSPRYRLDRTREYPFVEMAAVAENFGGILRFDTRKLESSGLARFKLGDVLFGKITPCAENGKVALVKELPGEFGLGSTEFIVLSPRSGNDPRFVYALLCSNPVHGRAVSRMEGSTGRLRVTEDTFTKWLLVPVPPAEEQAEIAYILDAINAAIESTRTAIDKARRVRRAIIQRFMDSGLGHISAADRPGKCLAGGWRLASTGKLLACEPKNGISPRTETQPPGYPTFSIAAVRDGKIDLMNEDHRKYARIRPELAREFALRPGDLLIVRGNANPDLVGLCGIVAALPDDCIYPDILKRVVFRDEPDGVIAAYVAIVWNHPVVHNQVLKRAKTSNGTLKINSRDVKQIVMPVPPKRAQQQLVNLVSAAESEERALTAALAAQERLKRGLMQDLLTGKVRVRPSELGQAVGAAVRTEPTRAAIGPS